MTRESGGETPVPNFQAFRVSPPSWGYDETKHQPPSTTSVVVAVRRVRVLVLSPWSCLGRNSLGPGETYRLRPIGDVSQHVLPTLPH